MCVLDGKRLPGKAEEQARRRQQRDAAMARVQADVEAGDEPAEADISAAAAVTPESLQALVDAMRRAGQQLVVAPYEADAQMVWLGGGQWRRVQAGEAAGEQCRRRGRREQGR